MEFTFHNRYGTQLFRTATHIYLAPHPSLRPCVAHYTLCLPGEGAGPPGPLPLLTLVPDASGCLVFTLTPAGPEGRMYGPTTRAVSVANDLGLAPPRFFVEFRPGGLLALTGLPQWELTDRVWPLSETAPALHALAWEAFAAAADLDDFAKAMDAAFVSLRPQLAPAAGLLRLPMGELTGKLSALTGYSPRHLSRLFRETAGMGCKSYLRVLRVNAAARRLRAHAPSLTALAQELGYFDQSHFIHDFKSVCGVTPGAYRADLSGFYNEPLKF